MHDAQGEKHPIFYTRLIGFINDGSAKEVIKDIDTANSLRHIQRIVLTVSSKGGWLYEGFALYDYIKASAKPIDIVAAGTCFSSALMIMQAGHKRIALPHTRFMIHPSNNVQEEKKPYAEFITMVDEYRRNHDLFVDLSVSRSKLTRPEFEKLYEPRKYFSAQEAKEFGFIDELQIPK